MPQTTQEIKMPDGSTQEIPVDAATYPVSSAFPAYQALMSESDNRLLAQYNAMLLQSYKAACQVYLGGGPLKPSQPHQRVSHQVTDVEGTLYIWQADDGPLVGEPCPDRQPQPGSNVPAPPAVSVPAQTMNVPTGDILPVGYVLTAPDGSKWQKMASISPFGVSLWYQRISG